MKFKKQKIKRTDTTISASRRNILMRLLPKHRKRFLKTIQEMKISQSHKLNQI